MAARPTMAAVIAEIRRLTGDTAATPTFDDDAIETVLDLHRTDGEVELRAVISYNPAGEQVRLAYQAPVHPWEQGATIRGQDGDVLTPASADELRGRWTFADDTPETVSAVGAHFDVYGAAADVLETWAAQLARGYDFSAGDQRFQRSQRVNQLRAMARDYRRAARIDVSPIVRSDVIG